jgi:cell division protein FtsB
VSALEEKRANDKSTELSEKNLETAIKKGLSAPYAKVLLRLVLAALIITSLGMFVTGIMKYNEFQREKAVLEKERDAISDEIDELRFLIDSPMDYDYIVRVAREKLGLYLPDDTIYYNDYNDTKK